VLEPTPAVRNLRQYHPPLAGREGLRLDFNENTSGCSSRVMARLARITAEDMARYPERGPAERLIAGTLGLKPAQVLLTNGVDEAVHLLCETYLQPGDEALIPVPTFSLYEVYAGATGARAVTVQAEPDFRFPTGRVLQALTPRVRLVAIASPNNPTGAVARTEDLLAIAAAAPQAAVLVDEAYFEFYGKTLLSERPMPPNLFIARTFSKAYGMAGLRIGILAGATDQIGFVRRVASPYSVNAAALWCLPEALADQEYIDAYVRAVLQGRARLADALSELGVRWWPSQANFVLARFGDKRQEFVTAMKRRGILVRDRNSDPGCAGCVRITVGTEQQTDHLLVELRECLAQINWMPTDADER
jgi:histidinol-phosphate aminotransferase